MQPDRRIDLHPLPGHAGICSQQPEQLDQAVVIAFGLGGAERPGAVHIDRDQVLLGFARQPEGRRRQGYRPRAADDAVLAGLLDAGQVLVHPFVIGELALGQLRPRAPVLAALHALPGAAVASDAEVLDLIERHGLAGSGIGHVDAHLLAATLLTAGSRLWTRDKRLLRAAAGAMPEILASEIKG